MGNYISFSMQNKGKLVFPDGTVRDIEQPITVAELMLEHPQYFVIEFERNSTYKPIPLHADHVLRTGRLYLMVPMSQYRANGLSVSEANRMVLGARKAKAFSLFGACMAGEGSEEVEEVKKKCEEGEAMIMEEEMELLMCRQYSSKGWRPSLGTIEEITFERKKVPHWLF